MARKLGLTLAMTAVLTVAGLASVVSKGAAGPAQKLSETPTDISAAKKGPGGGGGGGKVGRSSIQRNVGKPSIQRNVGKPSYQRNVGKSSFKRDVGKSGVKRDVGKSSVKRDVGKSSIQQSKLTQKSKFGQVKIRNASKATIAGRNYSIWRGSHRVRHGGQWRTFVGLGTLGALMFGSAYYYPYAYIDAPAPYCEGLTEDGCQLQWREVPTIEGPTDFQCVAYCPWQ
jgi:hypothetical protein